MTKLRKQKRRKTFKHNVNRKRLRNKIFKEGNVQCKPIKDAWEQNKSVRQNMLDMGLSYDPNNTIKVEDPKRKLKTMMVPRDKANVWTEEAVECDEDMLVHSKAYVAEALEADANAPREKLFRLPKGQVQWITYLLDKYGNDYKAMAKDKKNYYQETWKQLRRKIKKFKSIPEQYSLYLKEKGLTVPEETEEHVTDDEW